MASHSSTFAQKIPWTEEPGGLQSMGSLESDTIERLHFHFSLSCIGEGNGNSLQCSCLENPRDGEAWWAAVSRVAQSRTRLKRLSSSSSIYIYIYKCYEYIHILLLNKCLPKINTGLVWSFPAANNTATNIYIGINLSIIHIPRD